MIVPDLNLLVYAVHAESEQHPAARAWLDALPACDTGKFGPECLDKYAIQAIEFGPFRAIDLALKRVKTST